MTDDEMYRELSRGCCNKHRVVETGCTTCAGQLAALDRVKAIVAAADALRAACEPIDEHGSSCRRLRWPHDCTCGIYALADAAGAFDAARGAK